MTSLERALIKLAQTLSDNGIPYMIIGGMANAVWGEPRATLDIDLNYLEPRIRELAIALERPEIWESWAEWKQKAEGRDG